MCEIQTSGNDMNITHSWNYQGLNNW